MRSETKLQAMTEGQNPDKPPTIQINISGGHVGVVNAGTIHTIEQNLSTVNEAGEKNLVEAIKTLTEAVIASKDLREEQQKEALENLEFLSNQPNLPLEKRSKSGVISAVLAGLHHLISTGSNISQIWSTWGPKLEAALRSMGII